MNEVKELSFISMLKPKGFPNGKIPPIYKDFLVLGSPTQMEDIAQNLKAHKVLCCQHDNIKKAKWRFEMNQVNWVILQDDLFDTLRADFNSSEAKFIGELAFRSLAVDCSRRYKWNGKTLRSVELANEAFLFLPSCKESDRRMLIEKITEHAGEINEDISGDIVSPYLVLTGPPPGESLLQTFEILLHYTGIMLGETFSTTVPAIPSKEWLKTVPAKPLESFRITFVNADLTMSPVLNLGGQLVDEISMANMVIIGNPSLEPEQALCIDATQQIVTSIEWWDAVVESKKLHALPRVNLPVSPLPHRIPELWARLRAVNDMSSGESKKEAEGLMNKLSWTRTENVQAAHVVVSDNVIYQIKNIRSRYITLQCLRDMANRSHEESCAYYHRPGIMNGNGEKRLEGKAFILALPQDEKVYQQSIITALGGKIVEGICEEKNNLVVVWDQSIDLPENLKNIITIGPLFSKQLLKYPNQKMDSFVIKFGDHVKCPANYQDQSCASNDIELEKVNFNPSDEALNTVKQYFFDVVCTQRLTEKSFYGKTEAIFSRNVLENVRSEMILLKPKLQKIPVGFGVACPAFRNRNLSQSSMAIVGYYRSTDMQQRKLWMNITADLVKKALNVLGVYAVVAKTAKLVTVAVSRDQHAFANFMSISVNQDKNEELFVNLMILSSAFDIFRGQILHSIIAQPILYIICGSNCKCSEIERIRETLRHLGKVGIFHHGGESFSVTEQGCPLLATWTVDGKCKLLIRALKRIEEVKEISEKAVSQLLKESDCSISVQDVQDSV